MVGGELSTGGPVGIGIAGAVSLAVALALALAGVVLDLKPPWATKVISAATATRAIMTSTVRSRFACFLSFDGGVGSSCSRDDSGSASRARRDTLGRKPLPALVLDGRDGDGDDGGGFGAPPPSDRGEGSAPPRMALRFCSLRLDRVGFFATGPKLPRGALVPS